MGWIENGEYSSSLFILFFSLGTTRSRKSNQFQRPDRSAYELGGLLSPSLRISLGFNHWPARLRSNRRITMSAFSWEEPQYYCTYILLNHFVICIAYFGRLENMTPYTQQRLGIFGRYSHVRPTWTAVPPCAAFLLLGLFNCIWCLCHRSSPTYMVKKQRKLLCSPHLSTMSTSKMRLIQLLISYRCLSYINVLCSEVEPVLPDVGESLTCLTICCLLNISHPAHVSIDLVVIEDKHYVLSHKQSISDPLTLSTHSKNRTYHHFVTRGNQPHKHYGCPIINLAEYTCMHGLIFLFFVNENALQYMYNESILKKYISETVNQCM